MKAKLIFNLPEEQEDFNDAVNGYKYSTMVFHLKNNLWRELCKHTNCSEDYENGVNDAINSLLNYLED